MIDSSAWFSISPEIFLLVMTCLICLVDLGVKSPKRDTTFVLSLLTLLGVAVMEGLLAKGGEVSYGFSRMVVFDAMGHWLKCFSALAVLVTLVYARSYSADRGMLAGGEIFSLSLFALLGMMVMISGNHFLVLYLGLELLNPNWTRPARWYRGLAAIEEVELKSPVAKRIFGSAMNFWATATVWAGMFWVSS